MTPRNLYLVRHAQSTWNAVKRWQGQADPPLSADGRAQADQLAKHFASIGVDLILSSDLARAVETAAPIARRTGGCAVVAVPALRELDVGSWTGMTRAEIEEREPGKLDLYRRGIAGWTDGETYEQHEARSHEFVASLARYDAEHAVIVSHGGSIRAIVRALLGIDTRLRHHFSGIHNCSVSQFTAASNGDGWLMVTYGAAAPRAPRND